MERNKLVLSSYGTFRLISAFPIKCIILSCTLSKFDHGNAFKKGMIPFFFFTASVKEIKK